ncbi:MAG: GNAT family N-acetyltransferase [Romboutsia sp.]|uniref:GNAT family N-acetyltransferase n=1 Tax=Romboutsia sp. TaxID=1965302 RepID=UPI003F2E5CE8
MENLNQRIIQCELEYQKCFSKSYEKENIVRFRDDELPDMYYHNYTYIENEMNKLQLQNAIDKEITVRLYEKGSFCNLVLNGNIHPSIIDNISPKPEVSRNGYYNFDISKFSNLSGVNGCFVKKVVNQEMLDDVLFCDLQHDEEILGKEFCYRRCYRRGNVYLSNENINSYICYHNSNVIGNCDLFIYNGIAKIEDFAVIPRYQRMGYGTNILKSLINTALKENCHTIYLVADEEDTPIQMYKKLGFSKVGERTDLFFRLYNTFEL